MKVQLNQKSSKHTVQFKTDIIILLENASTHSHTVWRSYFFRSKWKHCLYYIIIIDIQQFDRDWSPNRSFTICTYHLHRTTVKKMRTHQIFSLSLVSMKCTLWLLPFIRSSLLNFSLSVYILCGLFQPVIFPRCVYLFWCTWFF